jgi:hypothetical protein
MGLHWTEEQYKDYLMRTGKQPEPKPKKKSKYNANRVTVDGITFDSQKEAEYYSSLKLLHRAGVIAGFCRQAEFVLNNGDEPIRYKCDFVVFNNDGSAEIVDVKGMETDIFKLKHKLFKQMYPGLKLKVER